MSHDPTESGRGAPHRSYLPRRALLKAAGVGLGVGVVGTTAAGGQSGTDPYTAVIEVGAEQITHATVDPLADLVEPTIPTDPDILGEGEGEEVPRGTPDGGSGTGTTSDLQVGTSGSGLVVETDYDGFNTRDVVRGIDLDDDGTVEDSEIFFFVPSDAQIATGPESHVTVINSEIGFIDKDDPVDGADRAGGPFDDSDYLTHYRLEDFFHDVLSLAEEDEDIDNDGTPDPLQFENILVFDPRARFDPNTGRFLVACVEFNLSDTKPDDDGSLDENGDGDATDEEETVEITDPNDFHGAYLLAISTTVDPTDPWEVYRVEPASNFGLVDYPTLGYDSEAVYLAQNFFGLPGFSFEGATLTVLDVADLADGTTDVDGWEFTGLRNPDGSLAFTLQPAAMPGSAATYHLANSRFGNGQTITVWDLEDQADLSTRPSLANGEVPVAPYANAPAAEQDGSNKKIDTLDSRLIDLAYDPSDDTLWTAHTTAPGHIRWYEIDPAGPGLRQSAGFSRETGSTFLPTVESNGDSMMMVYNRSAEQSYAGIEVAGRTDAHDTGELEAHAVVHPGEVAYDYDDTKGDIGPGPEENVLRWGDYNGVTVDPDDGSYWVISQYAEDPTEDPGPRESELYGTRIANVEFDDT